jgi:thiamine-monophosphate kinase
VTERVGVAQIRATAGMRPGTEIGIGDDAAVLALGERSLACHDILIEGVHFRRETTSLEAIGRKAVAVNLSDIAAMGGVPRAMLVGLTIPEHDFGADDLAALYAGIEGAAAAHEVTIAGGDTTSGPVLALGVTMLGALPPGCPPLTRGGARPGDLLCVTGPLGAAAAGLMLLEGAADPDRVADARTLIDAHVAPEARLVEGRALAMYGAHAGLDISDGLALDASRLAAESGLGAVIDLDAIPIAPGVVEVARAVGVDADVLAATGGEDYELLAAIPPGRVAPIARRLPRSLTPVGRLRTGAGIELHRGGRPVSVPSLGWERP